MTIATPTQTPGKQKKCENTPQRSENILKIVHKHSKI